EVTINNKKVIGSAQSRKDGVLLQHGSIILDFDVEKLFKLIKTSYDACALKHAADKFSLLILSPLFKLSVSIPLRFNPLTRPSL
ncbi:lipoyl protein ligase domain-containing protein, partial [Clostridioides difficile]